MEQPVQVTAAIFVDGQKVLIARRKSSGHLAGMWEFPGGKIEPNETPEDCLKRELREELNIEVDVERHFATNIHHYDHMTIELLAYRVRWVSGELNLNAHQAVKDGEVLDFIKASPHADARAENEKVN